MTTKLPLVSYPLGDAGPSSPFSPVFFDASVTLLSQYANSPILRTIITNLNRNIDPQADFDTFYRQVWNVDTAVGYGLDVWGRIVGVNRVLHLAIGGYLGWDEATDASPWNQGIWYGKGALTTNFSLSDDAFRRLILAKAASNITDGSIPAINRILLDLFGQGYVRDNLDMTMTLVFSETLDPVDFAIVVQSGVLPQPAGVTITVEQP